MSYDAEYERSPQRVKYEREWKRRKRKDPEWCARALARDRIWRANNQAKIIQYREASKGKLAIARKRYTEANTSKVRSIKINTPCADCGQQFHFSAMQFDHIRGDKVMGVSAICRRTWVKVQKEIDKCEVVCANCHAIRTWRRAQTNRKPPV